MKDDEANRFSDELIVTYRETVNELYEFVSRRSGGSRELAEDVTQETYLRATTAWPSSGLPDCPLAWLRTVARNLLLNHYRRRRPVSIEAADLDTVLGSAPSDGTEAARLVCWGLARLKAREARLLEAFYIDERPVRSIAADFGVTERAIEGRLRRARLALKKLLLPHVGTTGEMR
ncbi:MAG: sigma-70 family RNA polymerase sigma factor [Phycisphaerales bacterium]|nr:MAG: sigma-70 family RNA polymerase sigma factor [Phycisphaerales bacterium]